MKKRCLIPSLVLLFNSPLLFADTEQTEHQILEEVFTTGKLTRYSVTKSDTPIMETARSVSIITEKQFTERGALTLDDTLNYTAGIVGDTFGYSTRGDFPRIRGLNVPEYLDNIQVLFGFYNNARTEVYTLEQVEVLKGPASVLYGEGSPGGIVNAISKRAGRDNLEREIKVNGGSHDRMEVATDMGFDLSGDGKLTARFVALYRDSDTQVDHVKDDSLVLAPSITFENDNTLLTALANYTDRESDTAQQFSPLTVTGCASSSVSVSNPAMCAGASGQEVDSSFYAGDPHFNRYDTESTSVTLFGQHMINEVFSMEGTARYRDSDADYSQSWISSQGSNPSTLPNGTAIGRSWYDAPASAEQIAIDSRLRAHFKTGGVFHEVLFGINYQKIDTDKKVAYLNYPTPAAAAQFFPMGLPTTFNVFSPLYNGSEIPPTAYFDAVRRSNESNIDTLGIYINDQVEIGNLIVNAGLRYDEVENDNDTSTQNDYATTYSVGALYRTAIGLNPYISYAESFDPVIGTDLYTNQQFDPQEGEQTEVGLKYQPQGTQTYVTIAFFDIEQTNLPDPLAFPGAPAQQKGTAKIKGVEIEGQAVIGDFHLQANYTLLDTENSNGENIEYVPEKQASAWLTWVPSSGQLSRLRIGAGVRYAGKNESNGNAYLFPNPLAPSVERITTDSYTVIDSLIAYDLDDISLALNIRNLLDKEYYGTCAVGGACFAAEERTVVGSMTYHF